MEKSPVSPVKDHLWFWGASFAPHPQGDRNGAQSGAGCGVGSSAFVQVHSRMAMPGDFQRAAQGFMCPCVHVVLQPMAE